MNSNTETKSLEELKKEFIDKWVIAFDSKEQELEFKSEMDDNLDALLAARNERVDGEKVFEHLRLSDILPSLDGVQKRKFIEYLDNCLSSTTTNTIEVADELIKEIDKQLSDFKHDLKESVNTFTKTQCEGAVFGLNRLKKAILTNPK